MTSTRLLLLSLMMSGVAQSAAPEEHFDLKKISLNVTDGALQVNLRGVAPTSVWVVAVRVDSTKSPHFAAGRGSLIAAPHGRQLTGFEPLTASTPVSPGSLTFDLAQEQSRAFLFFAVVSAPVKITISTDQTVIANTTVSQSLLMKNGEALSQPVNGFADAFRALRTGKRDTPAISRMPNGEVFVSKENLRLHLSAADTVPSIGFSDAIRRAFLVVEISTAGRARVLKTTGDAALGQAAQSSIATWNVTPFQLDGQTVTTRTTLLFGGDVAGQIGIVW